LLPRVLILIALTFPGVLLGSFPAVTSAVTMNESDRVVSPGGSNSASGSRHHPWQTLQKAANSVPAGGTVWVRQGTYAGFTMVRSGLVGDPTRFMAWPGDDRPVIDGDIGNRPVVVRFQGVHDVRIQGFIIRDAAGGVFNGAGVQTDPGSERIKIIDNVITRNQSFGVYPVSSTNITVQGNDISHNAAGIYVSHAGAGTRILDNDIHDTDRMIRNTTSPGNDDAGGDGIAFHKTTGRITVSGNRLWSNRALSHDYGWDGGAFSIYGASNVTFSDNRMWDNENVMETGTDSGLACAGNSFVRNVAYGAVSAGRAWGMFLRCATDMLIAQNTFVDLGWAFAIGSDSATYSGKTDGLRIINNVIDHSGSGGKVYGIVTNLPNSVVIDHNLVWTTGDIATWPSGGRTASITAFRSATGYESHGKDSSPDFMDRSGVDFRLRASSPAIDLGTRNNDVGGGYAGAAPDAGRYER